jgi:hypothetical protein
MKYARAFCQSWYWDEEWKSPGAAVKIRFRQINWVGAGKEATQDKTQWRKVSQNP